MVHIRCLYEKAKEKINCMLTRTYTRGKHNQKNSWKKILKISEKKFLKNLKKKISEKKFLKNLKKKIPGKKF